MKNPEDHLLDDLAPRLKREKRKHKYQSTKGLPVDVAIRRQAAGEASAENPLPRVQKDAILMKYGVVAAVIEREIRKPLWKNKVISQHSDRPVEVVWNSMIQEWFKATKGMVLPSRSQQRSPGSGRGYMNRRTNSTNWPTNSNRHPNSRPELGTLNKPIRLWNPSQEAPYPAKSRPRPIDPTEQRWYPKNPQYQRSNPNNKRSSEQMDKSIKYPQN
jgi:hypothetical protein